MVKTDETLGQLNFSPAHNGKATLNVDFTQPTLQTSKLKRKTIFKSLKAKWYYAVFLLPTLVNLIASALGINSGFGNLTLTLFTAPFFITFVLIVDRMARHRVKSKNELSTEEIDRQITLNLMTTISVYRFEHEILNQNAWYGYRKATIERVREFIKLADENYHYLTDGQLATCIKEVHEQMIGFNDFVTNELDFDGRKYALLKDSTFYIHRAQQLMPQINAKAELVYRNLCELHKIAAIRHYL